MKHKLSLFLLVPLTVLSCSTGDHGFSVVKGLIDQIEVSDKHPYYRVVGVLDFNNSYTEVDSTFDKLPNGNIFVPYARYIILHNHSYIHCFFTYRAQAATVAAAVLIIHYLTHDQGAAS